MQRTNGANQVTDDLLRRLAEAKGPCLTIILPTGVQTDVRIQMKDVIRDLERALEGMDVDRESLLAPIQAVGDQPGKEPGALVILRSPELFETFTTTTQLPSLVMANHQFQVRALLPIREYEQEFYILALSQNRTRLLHCTSTSSEEVPLPGGAPSNLADAMQTRKPDHTLDNRASGGPSMGSGGVMFGTSTDGEDKAQYIDHYFRALDKALFSFLRERNLPLVIVGVEHELVQYRQKNTYPHLVEPGVSGAPDGFKGGEMHRRALELLRSRPSEAVQKALEGFDKQVGTGHASVHAQDIIKAAHEGRVSFLFLRDNAEYTGNFDEVRQKVKRHDDIIETREDLLNDAAVQTLRHGGTVAVLTGNQIPNGVPVCALFRYSTTVPEMVGTTRDEA